jgi:hypothetical protein
VSRTTNGNFSDLGRIVSYPDGNVYRLVTLAYRVTVESFSGLRPSAESCELRFFSSAEIAELDVPATQLEVLRRFREEPTRLHLE